MIDNPSLAVRPRPQMLSTFRLGLSRSSILAISRNRPESRLKICEAMSEHLNHNPSPLIVAEHVRSEYVCPHSLAQSGRWTARGASSLMTVCRLSSTSHRTFETLTNTLRTDYWI